MNEFSWFVNDNNILDVDLKIIKFTWTNERCNDAHIHGKLDRILISQDCIMRFGYASLLGYPKNGLDHNLLLLET